MKWDQLNGSVQWSVDRKYCIVRAAETGPIWIAYRMGPTTGEQIGMTNSDELARTLCEDHASALQAARQIA